MHLTPRRVRIGLRDGILAIMARSFPPPPKEFSEFQRERISKAYRIVSLYLNKGLSVNEIARRHHRTHQMISLTLKLGIDYLLDTGYIRPVERKLAA